MTSFKLILLTFSGLASALLAPLGASAFPIFGANPDVTVVEYYNVNLGHYFMTSDGPEMDDIAAGKAGPGWVKTGYAFKAYGPDSSLIRCQSYCGEWVSRFYGTPGLGPNSHFYTADTAEAAGLMRPGTGWTYEKSDFRIFVPNAAGACAADQTPVYRLYNNRWMFNDSNHRYVTNTAEIPRLVAQGWSNEGIRFCSPGAVEVPLRTFAMAGPTKVMASLTCETESVNLGPCVAVNNLTPPSALLPPTQVDQVPRDYFDRTGMSSSYNYVNPGMTSPMPAAQNSFVQGEPRLLGIYVNTTMRGASPFTSINPLYQMRTEVNADGTDTRFFPWAIASENDVQLAMSFVANVKRLVVSPGSHGYGHPTIEFIDARSGHHVYFTVLMYGTVEPGDLLAPDVGTGKVIVGTTFRANSPYMRNFGLETFSTPSGFDPVNFWGRGGPYEYRMDRAEFQRIITAARSVDAVLSADVRDYMIDNYHFTNEVVGNGELGMNIADLQLRLIRR